MAKLAYNPSTMKVLFNPSTGKVKTQCCDACHADDCCCFLDPDNGIPDWQVGVTYDIDDEVKYASSGSGIRESIYKSLQNNNLNHTPNSNPTWWERGERAPCDNEDWDSMEPWGGYGRTPSRYFVKISGTQVCPPGNSYIEGVVEVINGEHFLDAIGNGDCFYRKEISVDLGSPQGPSVITFDLTLVYPPETVHIPPYKDRAVDPGGLWIYATNLPAISLWFFISSFPSRCTVSGGYPSFPSCGFPMAAFDGKAVHSPYYSEVCARKVNWEINHIYGPGAVVVTTVSTESGFCYLCHATHKASYLNRPETGLEWNDYWVKADI